MADNVSSKIKIVSAVLALGVSLSNGLAGAQPPTVAPQKAPSLDQGFMRQAMELNNAEIELGRLRSFAQQMVDAHRKDKDALSTLAAKKGVSLPAARDAQHAALHRRLSQESGIAFDRAYMRAMVNDHRKTVSDYQREANQGKDKETRKLAEDQLSGLKSHLKSAENIESRLQIGKTSK